MTLIDTGEGGDRSAAHTATNTQTHTHNPITESTVATHSTHMKAKSQNFIQLYLVALTCANCNASKMQNKAPKVALYFGLTNIPPFYFPLFIRASPPRSHMTWHTTPRTFAASGKEVSWSTGRRGVRGPVGRRITFELTGRQVSEVVGNAAIEREHCEGKLGVTYWNRCDLSTHL